MDILSSRMGSGNRRILEASILREAIQRVLDEKQASDLIGHIRAIKRKENRITIVTRQPIINAELAQYTPDFAKHIRASTYQFLPGIDSFQIHFI